MAWSVLWLLLWPINGDVADEDSLVRTFHDHHHSHRKDVKGASGLGSHLQTKQVAYIFDPARVWKTELRQLSWLGGAYTNLTMMAQRRKQFGTEVGTSTTGFARFLPIPTIGCGYKRYLSQDGAKLSSKPWSVESKAWVHLHTGATGLFEIWRCFPGVCFCTINTVYNVFFVKCLLYTISFS